MEGVVITRNAIIDLKDVRNITYLHSDECVAFYFPDDSRILISMTFKEFGQLKCKILNLMNKPMWIEEERKEDK